MATLIIHENSPEARAFIKYARTLPFVEESTKEDDLVVREEEVCYLSKKCIPGLPYTTEERIAAIRQAEENYKQGVPGIPQEEVMEKMRKKITP